MSFTIPKLNYIGCLDVSGALNASIIFKILFDPLMTTTGNVFMFEYKIQTKNTNIEPNNIKLGYINVDNASNSGIINQWTMPIPFDSNNLGSTRINREVSVRVYSGLINENDIVVSPWSNSLDIVEPPKEPIISKAFYDNSDLLIFLQKDNDISYNEIQFVVAYYYKDSSSNTTLWKLSDLINSEFIYYNSENYVFLRISEFGNVASDKQIVYTSVYAVYKFDTIENTITKNIYSVSKISNTFNALLVDQYYNAPNIQNSDIIYNIYLEPHNDETMVIKWKPPLSSIIKSLEISKYELQYSNTLGVWLNENTVDISNSLSYNFSVASFSCGTTLFFRLRTVLTNGTYLDYSNSVSKKIFRYANPPKSIIVNWSTANTANTLMDVDTTMIIDSSYNKGCGDITNWVAELYNSNDTKISEINVPYVQNLLNYSVTFKDISYFKDGYVKAYLKTIDTNSSDIKNGTYSEKDYFTSSRQPLFKNVYAAINFIFTVESDVPLTNSGTIYWAPLMISKQFNIFTETPNISKTQSIINNIYSYTFEVSPRFFAADNTVIPTNIIIIVSNSVGNTTYFFKK